MSVRAAFRNALTPPLRFLSCSCKSSFQGERCHTSSDHSHQLPELEQLVAIVLGVGMLVLALALVAYCILARR